MAEMTMVERVARAIQRAHDPDYKIDEKFDDWLDFVEHARAAIATLRDPSDIMRSAALDQYAFNTVGHWTASPAAVYEAMIDAALSEQP